MMMLVVAMMEVMNQAWDSASSVVSFAAPMVVAILFCALAFCQNEKPKEEEKSEGTMTFKEILADAKKADSDGSTEAGESSDSDSESCPSSPASSIRAPPGLDAVPVVLPPPGLAKPASDVCEWRANMGKVEKKGEGAWSGSAWKSYHKKQTRVQSGSKHVKTEAVPQVRPTPPWKRSAVAGC